MLVNILTAVTRPDNLGAISESIRIAEQANHYVHVDVRWNMREDPERKHVGGQALKNMMLDEIKHGWVCILDDDTIMHPQFLWRMYRAYRKHPDAKAIVVSQKRTTGVVLQAKPENMRVGMVDAGQVCIRRDWIGDDRIPETYAGDGEWIEWLLRQNPDVVYLPQVLSLHNALSGVDVSETPERMGA